MVMDLIYTLPTMKRALESKGITVLGEYLFTQKEIGDSQKINVMIDSIKTGKNP